MAVSEQDRQAAKQCLVWKKAQQFGREVEVLHTEGTLQFIAGEIAQARAEGYRQGLEDAATAVERSNWSEKLNYHPDKEFRQNRTAMVKGFLAAGIRALAETGGKANAGEE